MTISDDNLQRDDVLAIYDAEECKCLLQHFHIGHSELFLQVERVEPREIFYIHFIAVAYLHTPVRWMGANFSLGSQAECLTLLRDLKQFDDRDDEKLLREYKLYQVHLDRTQVKIVASDAFITQKPSNYKSNL
jgi:hypothetical protein